MPVHLDRHMTGMDRQERHSAPVGLRLESENHRVAFTQACARGIAVYASWKDISIVRQNNVGLVEYEEDSQHTASYGMSSVRSPKSP